MMEKALHLSQTTIFIIGLIVNLAGWLAVSAWNVSRINTIQKYQELMIDKMDIRIDRIETRIIEHIEKTQFKPQPGVLYAAPQKDNRN
jgi:hypothetical protein